MEGISVVIKRDNKYLMLQQARTKPFPLEWLCVSGSVEEGETPEEAAIREAKEEAGLDIEIACRLATLKGDYKVEQLHFLLASWKCGEVKPDPREINDFGWFTYGEIMKLNLMRATKEFFENHFRE